MAGSEPLGGEDVAESVKTEDEVIFGFVSQPDKWFGGGGVERPPAL